VHHTDSGRDRDEGAEAEPDEDVGGVEDHAAAVDEVRDPGLPDEQARQVAERAADEGADRHVQADRARTGSEQHEGHAHEGRHQQGRRPRVVDDASGLGRDRRSLRREIDRCERDGDPEDEDQVTARGHDSIVRCSRIRGALPKQETMVVHHQPQRATYAPPGRLRLRARRLGRSAKLEHAVAAALAVGLALFGQLH
jgi:hypothetical protein